MNARRQKQSGFTVLELMISTTVFAVILLVCTTAIVGMTRLYYKSLSSSRVQEATRSIIDEISQAIQFSGGPVNGVDASGVTGSVTSNGTPAETRKYFCIDKKTYGFVRGKKVASSTGPTQTQNALIFNPTLDLCSPPPGALDAFKNAPQLQMPINGRQLVPKNMRIANLNIKALSNNLYEITVRVIYGDDDLICSPSVSGSCATPTTMAADKFTTNTDLMCKSQRAGSQFCAASELTTTVQKRVQ